MTWTWTDVAHLSLLITLPLMVMFGLGALAVAHSWRKTWRQTARDLKREMRKSSERIYSHRHGG